MFLIDFKIFKNKIWIFIKIFKFFFIKIFFFLNNSIIIESFKIFKVRGLKKIKILHNIFVV